MVGRWARVWMVLAALGCGNDVANVLEAPDTTAVGDGGLEVSGTEDTGEQTGDTGGGTADTGPSVGEAEDLGEPCAENADCSTGFCIEGPLGPVCSQLCVEECPEGYRCKGLQNAASDVTLVCAPVGTTLCSPCTTDLQCGGGVCAAIDATGGCTVPCETDGDCTGGAVCADLTVYGSGEDLRGCMSPSGSCSCTAADTGLQRTCYATNELGSCAGVETCEGAVGWTGCTAVTPVAEECNGVDDDCDGLVDEGVAVQTCEVTSEHGSCAGMTVCAGGAPVCQAPAPEAEVCDLIDNDCDGATDEPFKVDGAYATIEHCGACNKSCAGSVPNGTPSCVAGEVGATCGVASCDKGFFIAGKQCLPDLQTLCQPCATAQQCYYPGAACLDLGDGNTFCTKPCEFQVDCPGGYECTEVTGSEAAQCVPVTGSCTCDGSNLALQRECQKTTGGGDEPVVVCTGYEPCTGDGWGACVMPEDLCDGSDNDCNGSVDDGYRDPATGKYTSDAHCGQCHNSCLLLSFPHAAGTCDATLAVPSCRMQCDAGWHDVNENPNDGCECEYLSATDHPYGGDANCDGVDGEILGAIFVAKSGSDVASGSIDAPVFTVAKGIALAQAQGKRDVYVATGVYVESVALSGGVAVYGGYSADFRQHEPQVYETAILGLAPTASLPGAVNAIGLSGATGATRLDGFSVFGANGVTPGESSYAIYVRDIGATLTISNCHVVAGDGAPGADGESGAAGALGTDGKVGVKAYDIGTNICSSGHHNGGAAGGSKTCGGANVSGGKGGNSICPDFDVNCSYCKSANVQQAFQAQESGGQGQGNGGGNGAGGEPGGDGGIFTTTNCGICHIPPDGRDTVGQNGGHGSDGGHGTGGAACSTSAGYVQGALWRAHSGGSGHSGGHGGGGGGGGAGGSVETGNSSGNCSGYAARYDDIGGSGGGGGSGGCGGTAGTGGGGGGGSFGIFLVFTSSPGALPNLEDNVIERGFGGDGGHGGQGGVGGPGGSGGEGGASGADNGFITFCAPNGGSGGDGGNGGHGGGGAGGCGGVSFGVYVYGAGGAGSFKSTNTVLSGGGGGAGGPGGFSSGKAGANGQTGQTGNYNF